LKVYQIAPPKNPKIFLHKLGVDSGGIGIIIRKMNYYFIQIKELRTPGANILKQEALSVGAELAVPAGTIICESRFVDALLIANRSQIEILIKKCQAQPFGLSKLAQKLKDIAKEYRFPVKIMGVINANSDSFYYKSRFKDDRAIAKIEEMIEQGVEIIDIGGVSSRPGALGVSAEEELKRVAPICKAIENSRLYEKALFSIDSYTSEVIKYALDSGFGLINDITGAKDSRVVELAVDYGAKLCIMHMQGTPKTMQKNPKYDDVVDEVDSFFEERIKKCEELGLSRESIILDVGVGFGKTLNDNLELIRNHKHFKHFGCELLIGASRKSMIDMITPTPIEQRLPGTLAIHLKAVENGATIIRCHDTKEHIQALKVWESI
jgi:dihydropteroate synthase